MITRSRFGHVLPPTVSRRVGRVAAVVWWGTVVAFIVLPLVAVLGVSVTTSSYWEFPPDGFTLDWYRRFFGSASWRRSIYVSVSVGVIVSILGTLLGILVGLGLTRNRRLPAEGLGVVALMPLLFPNLALGLAILLFFINTGVPVAVWSLVLAQLVLVMPFTIRLLMVAGANANISAERAALNLGASPLRVIRDVTLPGIRPAVVAAAILALVVSLDDASVALFVRSGDVVTLPVRLLLFMEYEGGPLIAAGGSILLLTGLAMFLVVDRVLGVSKLFSIAQK